MARLHGKDGSVSFDGGTIAHIKSWTCDREVEEADGTEFGDSERRIDTGLKNSSGSFTCYASDTNEIVDVGTGGNLTLTLGGSRTLVIVIKITGWSASVNLDGNIEVTYNWKQGGGDGSSNDFAIN